MNPRTTDERRGGAPDLRGNRSRRRKQAKRRLRAKTSPFGRKAAGLHAFFTRELWSRELASLPTFRRWGYGVAQVAHLTCTNFVKDRCSWRASALTYITVLSLVPMLAFAFSVAKGMGAYDDLLEGTIIPFLDNSFGSDEAPEEVKIPEDPDEVGPSSEQATDASEDTPSAAETPEGETQESGGEETEPIEADTPSADAESNAESVAETALEEATADTKPAGGAEVRAAIDTVLGFVQKTDVSRLGVLGFLIVFYTILKLLGAVELSFNDIWGVRKMRSLPRKIADYLSTVVLVPLLLVTGTGVLNLAKSDQFKGSFGIALENPFIALLGSLVVVWLAFAFAYMLMPNTRVRLVSALVGGVVGGTIWQLFQYAHVKLQVGVANYNAIYSTFAALPIFLFWVQTSWMTMLFGAEAAAAHQNQARHGQLVRSRDYDLAQKEELALQLVARIAEAFTAGRPPLDAEDLADELNCPERTLTEVAVSLESAGILAIIEGDEDDQSYVLVADPGIVRIQDVLDGLKGESIEERDDALHVEGEGSEAAVDRAFAKFREERDRSAANVTLRELSA